MKGSSSWQSRFIATFSRHWVRFWLVCELVGWVLGCEVDIAVFLKFDVVGKFGVDVVVENFGLWISRDTCLVAKPG